MSEEITEDQTTDEPMVEVSEEEVSSEAISEDVSDGEASEEIEAAGQEDLAEPSSDGTDEEASVEGASYDPDFSFKVMEGEAEFDDWAKTLITDKDTEERLRDLYTRAHGVEYVKQDRQVLRDHNTQLIEQLQEFEPIRSDLDKAVHHLKNNDFESFKDTFGITDEMVMNYALHKLKLEEAPPEERQRYEEWRQLQQQNYELSQQNQNLQQQQTQTIVSQRAQELDATLTQPQVSEFARQFDERAGQEGAFRQEVILRGAMHYNQTKQDLPPETVANHLINLYGGAPAGQPQHSPNQPTGQQAPRQSNVVSQRERPPVIPSMPGSSASPVKKAPRSLADLKALAQQFEA